MRAIWKGHIRFSLVTIPIRVYNAVESAAPIRFNQLHKEDGGRIGYEKKCKVCGETVKPGEIVKAYAYEPDQYVTFDSADFEKIRLKSTKVIEMEGFIDASQIDTTLYDSPYFVGPDGPVATRSYALLSNALKETGKLGIGKVVLRDREEVVLVGPHDSGIVLYKIRYPDTLRKMNSVPMLEEHESDAEQLKLAVSLIESMQTSLENIELKDQYQDAVREMIQAKIEGKETVTGVVESPQIIDIMSALKESIAASKLKRKPMSKSKASKPRAAKKAKKAKKTVIKRAKAA